MRESLGHSENVEQRVSALHAAANELAVGIGDLRRLLGSLPAVETGPTESPCHTCAERDTCTSPCERLEKVLPKAGAGQVPIGGAKDVPLDVLRHDHGVARVDDRDLMDRFRACWHELTRAQREVVSLVFGEGLSQKEAAKRLGKSAGTISEHVTGATARLEAFRARNSRSSDSRDE